MRQAARTDGNQKAIVEQLRDRGYRVLVLSGVHGGCPDILVGNAPGKPRFLVLIELKNGALVPSKQRLTDDEADFHRDWSGCPVYVCNSLNACLAAVQDAVALAGTGAG